MEYFIFIEFQIIQMYIRKYFFFFIYAFYYLKFHDFMVVKRYIYFIYKSFLQ